MLAPGRLYRVRAAVPLDHVGEVRARADQKALLRDIERRLAVSGFQPTLAIVQDPTDNRVFQAIARHDPSATGPGGVQVLSAQPVDEPPPSPGGGASPGDVLDPGLTADEVWTVQQALTRDTNPRHLYGLADTFSPFFPVAASLIAAKATLVEGQAGRNIRALVDENDKRAHEAAKAAVSAGKFASTPEALAWLRSPIAKPVDSLRDVMARAGVRADAALLSLATPTGEWAWEYKLDALTGAPAKPALQPARIAFEQYVSQTRVNGKSLPMSVAHDEVKRAACDCMRGDVDDLKSAPAPVRNLGRALVTELGYGVSVVRREDLLAAMPPTGQEGFVSPSALQLALATSKPMFSRVINGAAVPNVMSGLVENDAKDLRQHIRAKNQFERAERALERRRWVEWHRRAVWQW